MDRLDNMMRELRATAQPADDQQAPDDGAMSADGQGRSRKRSQPRRHSRSALGRMRRTPRNPVRSAGTRWRRPLLAGFGVVAGVVALLLLLPHDSASEVVDMPDSRVGGQSPLPTETASLPAPSTVFVAAPTPLQWRAVIEQLDMRRGLAFLHADVTALYAVDASQSPALASDEAMVTSLVLADAHASSFPLRVSAVREEYLTVGERNPRAMLTVTDSMGAYDLVDAKGKVLRHVPARSTRTWHVELQRSTLYGWVYVSAVSAAST